jgi:hypothetical protein
VYDQLHLAADALESRFHLEFQNIAGVARRGRVGQKRFQRPCLDQVVKPVPIHSDLDVLRSDIDTADERQENGSYRVRCERRELP